jgi:hypothetical protein
MGDYRGGVRVGRPFGARRIDPVRGLGAWPGDLQNEHSTQTVLAHFTSLKIRFQIQKKISYDSNRIFSMGSLPFSQEIFIKIIYNLFSISRVSTDATCARVS